MTLSETDSFVETLRSQSQRYHDQHPFHRKMNGGQLGRRQIQAWVANRYYYQENIPRKDVAILANCHDREVRRRWIRRILDHDGTAGEEGGIEAWLRLGEAVELTPEEVRDECHVVPGVRFAVDAYVHVCTHPAVGRGGGVLVDRTLRAGSDVRAPRRVRTLLPVDRPGRARLLPGPAAAGSPRDSEHALEVVTE